MSKAKPTALKANPTISNVIENKPKSRKRPTKKPVVSKADNLVLNSQKPIEPATDYNNAEIQPLKTFLEQTSEKKLMNLQLECNDCENCTCAKIVKPSFFQRLKRFLKMK